MSKLPQFATGDGILTVLCDGTDHLPLDLLLNLDRANSAPYLKQALDGKIEIPINTFLYQTGDRNILIDGGGAGLGALPQHLATMGITPSQIDTLFCTHLHPDHTGGLLQNGAPVFANATLRVHHAEPVFWQDPALGENAPPQFQAVMVCDGGQRTVSADSCRRSWSEGAHNARQLIAILDDDERYTPDAVRIALGPLATTLIEIEGQIAKLDKAILTAHRNDDVSLRLSTIPGIDPVIATCLSASVPDAKLFVGGREFAAWLGLVPRQHSTGGKPRLGSISKMGNRRLRKLLVVGAHAALYRMKNGKIQSPLADWARTLLAKKSFKLVGVALANKIARIAWAIMARNIQFQLDFVPDHRVPASV